MNTTPQPSEAKEWSAERVDVLKAEIVSMITQAIIKRDGEIIQLRAQLQAAQAFEDYVYELTGNEGEDDAMTVLKAYVKALQAAEQSAKLNQEARKWISVDERLPDCSHKVLLFIKPGNQQTGFLLSGRLWSTGAGFREFKDVTHWQKLPEPPALLSQQPSPKVEAQESEQWISTKDMLPKNGQLVFARYDGVYDFRPVTFWCDSNPHFGLPNEPDGKGSQPATHWRDAERFLENCHAIIDAHKPKVEPPQDPDYAGRIVNAETQGEKI